jgi:hypothetical protein
MTSEASKSNIGESLEYTFSQFEKRFKNAPAALKVLERSVEDMIMKFEMIGKSVQAIEDLMIETQSRAATVAEIVKMRGLVSRIESERTRVRQVEQLVEGAEYWVDRQLEVIAAE